MKKESCDIKGCNYNIKGVCYTDTPPFVSCGNKKNNKEVSSERRTPLSSKLVRAYKMFLKGKSFLSISKELKCNKSTAYEYVKKAKGVYKDDKGVHFPNDKGLCEKPNASKRLHNDVISFLIEPIDFWGEKNIVKLKFTKYLLIKQDSFHIQIFPSKLVVRFLDDIVCKTIGECKKEADRRVLSFLKSFRYKGVRFLNGKFEQVSRHYALLGTSIAKKFVRENKKFYVFDKTDGKRRLVIDNSKDRPEFEAEHSLKGLDDAKLSEAFFDDMINNSVDLPSVSKNKTDKLMGDYIKTIKVFDERMNWFAKNNISHEKVLKDMGRVQKETLKTLKVIQKNIKK